MMAIRYYIFDESTLVMASACSAHGFYLSALYPNTGGIFCSVGQNIHSVKNQ